MKANELEINRLYYDEYTGLICRYTKYEFKYGVQTFEFQPLTRKTPIWVNIIGLTKYIRELTNKELAKEL